LVNELCEYQNVRYKDKKKVHILRQELLWNIIVIDDLYHLPDTRHTNYQGHRPAT